MFGPITISYIIFMVAFWIFKVPASDALELGMESLGYMMAFLIFIWLISPILQIVVFLWEVFSVIMKKIR